MICHFHVFLWQKDHNGSSQVDSGRREIIIPWVPVAEQALVFLREGNSAVEWLDCKTSQTFRGFLPKTFTPVACSDERSAFIPIFPLWQISVTVAALGTQSTDKPLQLFDVNSNRTFQHWKFSIIINTKPFECSTPPPVLRSTQFNLLYFYFI